MKVVVLGASGATGKHVVTQLLKREVAVRILVRATSNVADEVEMNPLVEVVRGSISKFTASDVESLIDGCDAVVSCLGHNLTFKGMFGKPRNLVSDAVMAVCRAAKRKNSKFKFVLMSTSGYFNTVNDEKRSFGENIVNTLLMLLLPPHRDNMRAGDYFTKNRDSVNSLVEWVTVRPDGLVTHDEVSEYEILGSHTRSPIFDSGETSRINVGHFMAELLTNDVLWTKWQGKTPVIYNKSK